ncbi:Tom37 C-terminal domain-containing protein [Neohortaea acidophila]|uniref:Tom37 C-terminal domain-containing protein n=1 Tax=Neohortaea acidophila TaxID=245834 RepID=A0A6A6Q510_9PEZI|nr:Tom37 C-terminal domain-containing protein [Neohortaea acidophila]KAF2486497.1 Tom37 C-terminal domain-containing protein [Neohortaea acidophila]
MQSSCTSSLASPPAQCISPPDNPMELYILGPAFGLPSIDAECNAAVALLQHLHPTTSNWHLIPTHDQTRHLPYLLDDQKTYEGFQAIQTHLQPISTSNNDNALQSATSTALTSLLDSRAQPLLDITLYTSSENYRSATRPAFTRLLPWYANYTVPPRRRADAKKRTAQLGISHIDVDEEDPHEDLSGRGGAGDVASVGKEPQFEAESQRKAASLLLPRKDTLRSLLRRPEHSAIFRLHALAEAFFEPLSNMLEEREFFLGTEEMQAVDCAVYGYLSLMLFPELPQGWLRKMLRGKYPALVRFTERMHERLKMGTDVGDVMGRGKSVAADAATHSLNLPWAARQSSSFTDAVTVIASDLAARIPYIGLGRVEHIPATPRKHPLWEKRWFPAFLATTAASIGFGTYYAFVLGFLEWPRGEQVQIFGRKRFADYGHLGAALAGSASHALLFFNTSLTMTSCVVTRGGPNSTAAGVVQYATLCRTFLARSRRRKCRYWASLRLARDAVAVAKTWERLCS